MAADYDTYKPIPTTYNGVKYRSRLEAKWAIFFDLLGFKSIYEPGELQGWSPDFQITDHTGKVWLVEVKPIDKFDIHLARKLENAVKAGTNLLIVGTYVSDLDGKCMIGYLGHKDNTGISWSDAVISADAKAIVEGGSAGLPFYKGEDLFKQACHKARFEPSVKAN